MIVLKRLALVIAAPIIAVALSYLPSLANAQAANKTAENVPSVDWSKIPEPERKVLAPLEKDWAQLPGAQQRKLIGAAQAYPRQVPIQQERFQERIKDWAKLTPEQRKAARDKFQNLSSLPPAKQYELRERWNEKAEKSQVQGLSPQRAPSGPAASPSPAPSSK